MTYRIGHGYDIHRLQQGGRLVLGGVMVAEGISAVAHSDGDVVIHAIVDAVLGGLGKGDIGEHFPDNDPVYSGADSLRFLQHAAEMMRDAGFRATNVDITILAERPRLKPFKLQMIAALQRALGDGVIINIKAGTNEGCGEIGRGEAIAAHAVVLLASSN